MSLEKYRDYEHLLIMDLTLIVPAKIFFISMKCRMVQKCFFSNCIQ